MRHFNQSHEECMADDDEEYTVRDRNSEKFARKVAINVAGTGLLAMLGGYTAGNLSGRQDTLDEINNASRISPVEKTIAQRSISRLSADEMQHLLAGLVNSTNPVAAKAGGDGIITIATKNASPMDKTDALTGQPSIPRR